MAAVGLGGAISNGDGVDIWTKGLEVVAAAGWIYGVKVKVQFNDDKPLSASVLKCVTCIVKEQKCDEAGHLVVFVHERLVESYNPWEPALMGTMMQPTMHDPFYASITVAAPPSVQMADMSNQ
ncbi:hypothetical protein RJT34_12643 [Clitoria ternatea]|uniref:Uncharacterized protein n=1 Tax=Clitoria ternatea TaxID=43366 RepID=A0AAN9JPS5_CLITE